MISVCCCSINAKWDTKSHIELLFEQNKKVDFEIVLTHDNRVDDGASELYKELSLKYPRLKVVEFTNDEYIKYIRKCINLYKERKDFTKDFIEYIENNINKYEEGTLFDKSKGFLWNSTGVLYNKAISKASGDILLVSGADFLFPIDLEELENYVNSKKTEEGMFYGKPTAVFAQVTNSPEWYIDKMIDEILQDISLKKPSRKGSLCRDYLRYPSTLDELFIVDFEKKEKISLGNKKLKQWVRDFFSLRNTQINMTSDTIIPIFHGVHVMTKEAYTHLGGFTEEWYGRAFAEDKMTRRATTTFSTLHPELPYQFSFLWPGQAETSERLFPYYNKNYIDELKQKDPWFNTHPTPGMFKPTYLHSGYKDLQYIHDIPKTIDKWCSEMPVRLT